MTIYRGVGGGGSSTDTTIVDEVQTLVNQAVAAEEAAAISETNAANSATSASTSASNAANSASTATTQAGTSTSSATLAQTYASNALASSNTASSQASTATTQANAAANSATAASNSANSANSSASTATTQAGIATTQATNSASSAASALAIYGNTTAMNNAVTAASNSATAAAGSASTATTKASDAAASAATAAVQAAAALSSANDSNNSQASSLAYSNNAATSANSAAASATAANSSYNSTYAIYNSISAVNTAVANSQANRDAAAASATSASTSASTATTQAGIATTQAAASAASAAAASAVVLSNEPVRPTVDPTLLLDFANNKQLDPRITFARASTATYYDAKTSAKAEENLLVRSQEFDNASWIKSLCTVTANSDTAPDGTVTADTYTATSNNSELYQGYTAIAQPYTFSVWLKRKTGTGAVSILADGGTYVVQTITASWALYSVTQTPTAGAKVVSIKLATSGDEVYVWGAQLEQRSSVTAYTATTTAAITNYIPVLLTQQSNEARFDHNPTTRESLGLLREESRTNLLTYSDQFDNGSGWGTVRASVISNANIAPDGTQTADKLVEDTSTNSHYVLHSGSVPTIVNGTVYTASFYAKAGERTFIRCQGDATAGVLGNTCTYNLTTGVVDRVGTGVTSATMTLVGNGWYRCVQTATSTGTTANFLLSLATDASIGLHSYTGNGYSGVYIWGAQLEAGPNATSYIPTVASQVTRSVDTAVMTGTNFSSWFNQAQGTWYVEFVGGYNAGGLYGVILGNNDGTIFVRFAENAVGSYNGVTEIGKTVTGMNTLTTGAKAVLSYSSTGQLITANGASPTTSTALFKAPQTSLALGSIGGGTQGANCTIKKVAFYPIACTSAQIQGLTTV